MKKFAAEVTICYVDTGFPCGYWDGTIVYMRAPVTTAIIVINVLVFVAMAASGHGLMFFPQQTLIDFGGSSGVETIARMELWRLVTSAFVHAGLLHIAINMIVLAKVGPQVEAEYGRARYFGVYMAAAIAGNIASVAANPLVTTVGASGAMLGVYAAWLVHVWQNPEEYPPGCLQMNLQVLAGLVISSVACIFLLKTDIDNAAHAAGFVFGAVAALALQPGTRDVWPKAIALAGLLVGSCVIAVVALPKNGAMYFVRAGMWHKQGKDREAVALLTEAIAMDPKIAVAYNNRAWSYVALKQPAEAMKDADKSIALDPKSATTYDTRAMAWIEMNDPQKAIEDLNRAVAIKADDGAYYYHRAVAKSMAKDEGWKQDLQRARQLKYECEKWEPTVVD